MRGCSRSATSLSHQFRHANLVQHRELLGGAGILRAHDLLGQRSESRQGALRHVRREALFVVGVGETPGEISEQSRRGGVLRVARTQGERALAKFSVGADAAFLLASSLELL